MGSYADCWLGKFLVISTKNHFLFSELFLSSDKKIITSSKNDLPEQLISWIENMEEVEEELFNEEVEEEPLNIVFYSAPTKLIKDRLELFGYSLENSLNILHRTSEDLWRLVLQEIQNKKDNHHNYDEDENSSLAYMLRDNEYAFLGLDINVVLRLGIEILSENNEFIYNITDLVIGGWVGLNDNLDENEDDFFSSEYSSNKKIIVLTEGKSDALFLSKSLQLLYPHLFNCFSFIDFDGARVNGGAGSLANMVKSFSGAGIVNKIIAVFDNDTAAMAALKPLKKAKVSANIKIITLPDIDVLNNYPTLDPSGMVLMNVNGLAGSIEMYFGRDALCDDQGKFIPIKWTSYESSLEQYQGEIIGKDTVQKKFRRQLEMCTNDYSLIESFDWSGIKAIFEIFFTVFHEDDGKRLLFWNEALDS